MSNEEQQEEKQSELIENLADEVLKELADGKNSDKIEQLMQSVEEYAMLPNHKIESIQKWQSKVHRITQLLEEQYMQIQSELKNMVEHNPKLSAYDKADQLTEDDK